MAVRASPTHDARGRDRAHRHGLGPTVLLVHVGFWSYVWRDVIAELAPLRRCVALDAPGSGLSERVVGADTDLDVASRAIGAVMDELTEPFVLVVHDLGGVAGLAAAATRPGVLRGLVVVNSFAWRPSGIPFRSMLAVVGSSPMRELDAWTGLLPRVSSTRLGVGRHLTHDDRRAFRAGLDRHARRSFHRYMRSARTSDAVYAAVADALEGPLRDIPVQTVFGQRNDPLRFQPRWKQRFPEARQVVVPRGNHFPMCDAPATVAPQSARCDLDVQLEPATRPHTTSLVRCRFVGHESRPRHVQLFWAMSARTRVLAAVVLGAIAGVVAGFLLPWQAAILIAWDVTAGVIVLWVYATTSRFSSEETRAYASREDDSRVSAQFLLLGASLASLVGVGFDLHRASNEEDTAKVLLVALGLTTVVASWFVVHTVYQLRYRTSTTTRAKSAGSTSRKAPSTSPTTATSPTWRSRSARRGRCRTPTSRIAPCAASCSSTRCSRTCSVRWCSPR